MCSVTNECGKRQEEDWWDKRVSLLLGLALVVNLVAFRKSLDPDFAASEFNFFL